jgi:hypothetical protein
MPIPPKMGTTGILLHLSEDLYLLLQPELAVICVDVPEDGGTFTTSSGRRVCLHPTHGVLRLGRKQRVKGHKIQQVNVETHHDNSVVRRVLANTGKVEIKMKKIFDSPKAEWMPPSLTITSEPWPVDTKPQVLANKSKGNVLVIRCHRSARGCVERPVSQEAHVFLPMIAGLYEWITAEVMISRALLVPSGRYTEDSTIKVVGIDGLSAALMYPIRLFAPFFGRTRELDHLGLV